jgi:yeast amino acid transporter
LIIYGLVIDAGRAPLKAGGYDQLGFRFWGAPYGPFGHAQGEGTADKFLGFWSGMGMASALLGKLTNVLTVHALFSLMGIELVGVAVGEVANRQLFEI